MRLNPCFRDESKYRETVLTFARTSQGVGRGGRTDVREESSPLSRDPLKLHRRFVSRFAVPDVSERMVIIARGIQRVPLGVAAATAAAACVAHHCRMNRE